MADQLPVHAKQQHLTTACNRVSDRLKKYESERESRLENANLPFHDQTDKINQAECIRD